MQIKNDLQAAEATLSEILAIQSNDIDKLFYLYQFVKELLTSSS